MTDIPTVFVNPVSFGDGEDGFRVVLCQSADLFGADGEHVAETIAESRAEIPEAIRDLELELLGWDDVDGGDLDWLWSNRPNRISRSAQHFAGAVLEDVEADEVVNEFTTSDDGIDVSDAETDKSGSQGVKIVSHSDDCGHLDEYQVAGECLRCDQSFNTDEERRTKEGVIS